MGNQSSKAIVYRTSNDRLGMIDDLTHKRATAMMELEVSSVVGWAVDQGVRICPHAAMRQLKRFGTHD
jgi:hypothetical protein